VLRRSVAEIREEGKRQLRIGVAQEMEFQLLQQGVEFVGVCQQVGITTIVRKSMGIPFEKSMRGKLWGRIRCVTSQFTRLIETSNASRNPSKTDDDQLE
jgi:hypothetical protein